MSKVAVIGAGFAGSVIAREFAACGHSVDVFESRDHVAGNCHTSRDPVTGVMRHVYGPHIFHTDNSRVWNYVNHFGAMMPYNHRVKATYCGTVYSLPINLHTINQLFGTHLSPAAAKLFINTKRVYLPHEPRNFEEQALSMVGSEIYEAFLHGYTCKQWGMEPRLLPASILKRLPLRFDYNDSYFAHPWQAIPKHGYTEVVRAILDHKNIAVHLSAPMSADSIERQNHDHVFYTGPLDAWFNHAYGRLAYRTLDFVTETGGDNVDIGCPVMNFTDESVAWTRRTDFKYFTPWEKPQGTLIYREYSRDAEGSDIPYYPVRLADDKTALAQYTERANAERRTTFLGRLGTYRYLDMDVTIAESLAAADRILGRTVK